MKSYIYLTHSHKLLHLVSEIAEWNCQLRKIHEANINTQHKLNQKLCKISHKLYQVRIAFNFFI